MKKVMIGLLLLGLTIPAAAQEVIKLSEIFISASSYKYLNTAGSEEVAVPVQLLQDKVAKFDLINSEYYQDDYDLYKIKFYIPDGTILAAYDDKGNIIRTVEKYKDIQLPKSVSESLAKKYPNWDVAQDWYLVNYSSAKESANKRYKIKLVNGDKTIRVKMDEYGNFL